MLHDPVTARAPQGQPVSHGARVAQGVGRMLDRIVPHVGGGRVWLMHFGPPGVAGVYGGGDGSRPGAVFRGRANHLIAPWLEPLRRGENVLADSAAMAGDGATPRVQGALSVMADNGLGRCLLLPVVENGALDGVLCIENADIDPVRLGYLADMVGTMVAALSLREDILVRESQQVRRQMESALNALPDSAVLYDADERFVTCNPAFHRHFPEFAEVARPGMKLEELFRRVLAGGRYLPPDTSLSGEEWIEQALPAFRRDYHTDEIRMADGRWFRRVHSRTSDGGLICIAIDITARQRHIAALDAMNDELVTVLRERDEARRRLVATMAAAEVGTWELDARTETVTIGDHWAEILGYGHELPRSFPLARLEEMVHAQDRDVLRYHPAYDPDYGARGFEFEMRLRHRAGHWAWVLSRGQVMQRDDDGRPLRIVGVHLDISERKRLQEEVDAGQAQLRTAMENSVAAIVLYDDEGRLVFHNAEAARILHMVPGMRCGNPDGDAPWALEAVDGGPLPHEDTPYVRARAASGPVRDIRYAVRWPDGTRRILTCNSVAIDAGGGRRNVVLSFQDITDQLRATESLEQALASAEEMNRAKSVFLANMSHEIRTPLNGVLGLAEVLDMQLVDPAHKRMVASIRQSGATLLTVLNSILDMSKIEAGKLELDSVPFAIEEVIAPVAAVYAVQAEEKGLEFEVFSSSGCKARRIGDPHRIRQILHNLLNNAVKFTTDGSVTLDVSCRPGRPVVLRVSDTGAGMTREQAARAFDKFEQADAGTTRRFGGTGLGLAIVRELVGMMGGTITLEAAPDEGTTVIVSLPLACQDAGEAPAPVAARTRAAMPATIPPEAAAPGATRPLRILGADDNATNLEVLSGMIAQIGGSLETATNGQEAVACWEAARARAEPFDIVLLDIAMPVMDGPAAMERIRAVEARDGLPRVRIVAVTGHAPPEGPLASQAGGFDAYLQKPYDLRALRDILAGGSATGQD
ncbi:MAG: PAS domain S-box protein [Rubellimicrobium sp.]|nr:PAS domain S-box protein [Rubellimicrobium sp.]